MPIYVCVACVCFPATADKLSSCDHMAHEVEENVLSGLLQTERTNLWSRPVVFYYYFVAVVIIVVIIIVIIIIISLRTVSSPGAIFTVEILNNYCFSW